MSIGIQLAKIGLKDIKLHHQIYTTAQLSKEEFAKIVGGQLRWGISEQFRDCCEIANQELNNWAQRDDSFGQLLVSYASAER